MRRRAFRVLTPALLGATLVMMLRGDQWLALGLAVAFFLVYVGTERPRTAERPSEDPDA